MFTNNAFLFVCCSLIWGSTWIAITYQVNETALMQSVAMRFGIAAIVMALWAWLSGKSLRVDKRQHLLMCIAGIFLYTLDYSFLYAAQQHMISALLAVLSSSVIYFNVVLRRLILKKPIRIEVVIGASIGLTGIILIFSPEFSKMRAQDGLIVGLLFATASFLSASCGNIVSEKILDGKSNVLQLNFWAMSYGVIATIIVLLLSDETLSLPLTVDYYVALLYLAVFGSVFAFAAYMKLLQQLGSDKASYVMLVYPIVALVISTFAENYQWSIYSIFGVFTVLFGNAIAMGKLSFLLPSHLRARL